MLVRWEVFGEFGDNNLHIVGEGTEPVSERRDIGYLFFIGYDEIVQSLELSYLIDGLGSVAGHLANGIPLERQMH